MGEQAFQRGDEPGIVRLDAGGEALDPAAAAATPGTGCGADAGYSTIQAAITAAAAGDTINVCPGTYAGPISINKANLTLKGAKAGIPAGPSATPAGRGTDESIIESAGTNVLTWTGSATTNTTVDGFTLWQSGEGTQVIAIASRPGPCTGSGGRVYEDEVRVRLSGRELIGCGGRLVR